MNGSKKVSRQWQRISWSFTMRSWDYSSVQLYIERARLQLVAPMSRGVLNPIKILHKLASDLNMKEHRYYSVHWEAHFVSQPYRLASQEKPKRRDRSAKNYQNFHNFKCPGKAELFNANKNKIKWIQKRINAFEVRHCGLDAHPRENPQNLGSSQLNWQLPYHGFWAQAWLDAGQRRLLLIKFWRLSIG